MVKVVKKALTLPYKLYVGIGHALWLNAHMFLAKARGQRTFVVCIAEAHLIHVDSILRAIDQRKSFDKVELYVLTDTNTIKSLDRKLPFGSKRVKVYSALSIRFLLFCDAVLSVWEGQVYPLLGCRARICMFHNQPVKGITFGSSFNYRQINTLFLYGPLMRGLYYKRKRQNPHWPEIACYEVGQPLSDRLFGHGLDKRSARTKLGLDPERTTVIYAPSFEYCSSISTRGEEIIESLLKCDVNLIVKPHPNFYFESRFDPERDGAIYSEWRERIERYNSNPRCIFPAQSPLDSSAFFAASDILVTDYSSVAFDGIMMDMGMIYWHCPLMFSEYLPKKCGTSEQEALNDLASNAGREAGIVVHDAAELAEAVAVYRKFPETCSDKRRYVRDQLLFNPGRATDATVKAIEEILRVKPASTGDG